MTDTDARKAELRARMKAARRAIGPSEAEALADRAADHVLALPELRDGIVLCYVAVRRELPTRPILDRLVRAGIPVAVPRIAGDHLRAHLLTDLAQLAVGAFGVPTCDGPDVTDEIALCLTPGLAFTARGARLGYGGGYYDRFLADHAGAVPVGLCYDVQLVDDVPTDAHDHPMAAIVTPSRAIRVDPSAARAAGR